MHANSDMSVSRPDLEVTSNHGDLTYNMKINPGKVGGESEIVITPNHNVAGFGARLEYRNQTFWFYNSDMSYLHFLESK